MKIGIGTHRVIILIGHLAIKFPRFLRPFSLLEYMVKCKFTALRYDVPFTLSIFRQGIEENWHEYKCWKELKADFLMPTYITVLGLINIQKRSFGQPITLNESTQIWIRIARQTQGEIWKTWYHAIASRENYHRHKEGLKMFDYGGTRKFIFKWRNVFEEVLKTI